MMTLLDPEDESNSMAGENTQGYDYEYNKHFLLSECYGHHQ